MHSLEFSLCIHWGKEMRPMGSGGLHSAEEDVSTPRKGQVTYAKPGL